MQSAQIHNDVAVGDGKPRYSRVKSFVCGDNFPWPSAPILTFMSKAWRLEVSHIDSIRLGI